MLAWFLGIAPSFVLVTIRTLTEYRPEAQDVWAWFSPVVAPTLSVIIGGYIASARAADVRNRRVDGFLYRVSLGVSAFYLTIIFVLVIVTSGLDVWDALDTFRAANLPLGLVQGVVTALLAYFFVSSE